MSLLRRILVEKRLAITTVVALLVVDVGLFTAGVYPTTVRVASARQRTTAAAQALAEGQEYLRAAQAVMERKTQADAELGTFYDEVLPQGLAGARGITYPRLAALAVHTGLVMERRSSAPDQEEDSRLGRLQTTMLLAGEYRSIRRFIHELETSAEFIVIEEILVNQREDVDSPLVLTLGVSTYYRTDNGA